VNATVDLHSSDVQAQNRETINITWQVDVSFKVIMTTSVTRPCFTTQHQTCKTKTKTKTNFFWPQTGLVVRQTVSDHITAFYDIWPGNGAGPFLQPRSPHRACGYATVQLCSLPVFHNCPKTYDFRRFYVPSATFPHSTFQAVTL